MKWVYKTIRALILTALIVAIVVPVATYIFVSLPPVQNWLRQIAEKELSSLLDSRVSIGELHIAPFNQVALRDAIVTDRSGSDTIMMAKAISAGINLHELIANEEIVVTHAILRGVDARIWKADPKAPLNIQHIIDALQPKDKTKPPTRFRFRVNSVIIRQCSASYDVKSEPLQADRFDPNHIKVTKFQGDISLPMMMNDDFTIDVKRLSLEERSGLVIDNLTAWAHVSATELALKNFHLNLPNTSIRLANSTLSIKGWSDIKDSALNRGVAVSVTDGSYFNPRDLRCFLPALERWDERFPILIEAHASGDKIQVSDFRLGSQASSLRLELSGSVYHPRDIKRLAYDIPALELNANGDDIAVIAKHIANIPDKTLSEISVLGVITLQASGSGTASRADGHAIAHADPGELSVDAEWHSAARGHHHITASVNTPGIALGGLLHRDDIGDVIGRADIDVTLQGKRHDISADVNLASITFRGYSYSDIQARARLADKELNAEVTLNDPNAIVDIAGSANLNPGNEALQISGSIASLNLSRLNLWNKYPDYTINAELNADFTGSSLDNATGHAAIVNLKFVDSTGQGIITDAVDLYAFGDSEPREISLRSDFIDARIRGNYHFESLPYQVKEVISKALPSILAASDQAGHNVTAPDIDNNNFTFNVTLKENENLRQMIKLPFYILAPVTIDGAMDNDDSNIQITIDAPYLRQGNKLIENSVAHIDINGQTSRSELYITTEFPTKQGKMPIVAQCEGDGTRIDTRVNWFIDRERDYHGNLSLSALLDRDTDGALIADVNINPGELAFNDSVWTVHPATILYRPKEVTVNDLNVSRRGQSAHIDGRASTNPDDVLTVDLQNINLDYIFESLGLTNVMLGGDATGIVTGRQLFTKAPELTTDGLHVTDISYNKTVFGDADVKSHWDNERQSVVIDAVINQPKDLRSYIKGEIFPTREALDLRFDCDKVNVAFLKPYTQAFCSNISGLASGWAHLYGTFKDIDLEGRVYGEDVAMKIDVLNTTYHVTDSVRIYPGRISLDNLTISDQYGHTAKLNGNLTHDYFRAPKFNFQITDASDLLVMDITEKINPDWYGHVFGSGTASIIGVPGRVDIKATLSSGRGSTFTFVLNDRVDASEYNFLTFRDRTPRANQAADDPQAALPEAVMAFQAQMRQQQESTGSDYFLSLDLEATPDLKMTLVMDPAGGDRIVATGNGHLQLAYDSRSEDLSMRGIYTLDKGSYNFTLQDIIIRDFTINPGSSVTFRGDPYSAALDLQATYTTNANLSDLDESFLHDKELNRTKVPVQAVLNVKGDMRDPSIAFDLAFPTLSDDVYRKVRSIVSTDDMMNRQILYLLALNRFYTPEYMASATRGNELVSVASSTLSSQLGNILGHISDKFTIAPNLRSSKGDFSDVEFDIALSSQLLNNRLLFNGNLGYRDKSLNSSQFVGDFDLQYLLTRSGNLRLKAYNRYNDQNYYIKTAQTTQGVGIMLRLDFDRLFPRLRRRVAKHASVATDSLRDAPRSEEPIRQCQ